MGLEELKLLKPLTQLKVLNTTFFFEHAAITELWDVHRDQWRQQQP
jgi:hypothetical protein